MRSLQFFSAASIASLFSVSAALNLTVFQHGVPFAPAKLPAPGAASHADEIAEAFANLGRSTIWKSIKNITFEGETFEPEGMVRIGSDRFFVSGTEEIVATASFNKTINGTDRAPGVGFAHILVFDGEGKRIARATYSKPGDNEYHLGGIDYDGENVWGTIAQYRPNSTARVVTINPHTLEDTEVLTYNDHLGGIVHDTKTNDIYCLNWGARNASKFSLGHFGGYGYGKGHGSSGGFTKPQKVTRNPSYFSDYQDCKFLGHPRMYDYRSTMLCSGLTTYAQGAITKFQLGGLAIVDTETMVPLDEVPITGLSALGVVLTENPMDVEVVDGKLRFYWLPDQHNSTMYVYEAEPMSPYEF
ncbi:hypothetical protein NA57DRAFT_60802 [Rhizodiscina lignyota]|uniref:Uncharacterized protein n=1 Tax=Rhizodiscina lignyota TaxID=1504668 RepID=A0A9P4M4C9_9PEZI|nr:hypothetical protein NA57DRAFT_60802 [Rhizodiscina lignyota]